MLVLSRKPQQQIRIGEDITVTILQIRPRCVQIGIVAPKEVRILRTEVSERPPTSPRSTPTQSADAHEPAAESDGLPRDDGGSEAPRADVRPARSMLAGGFLTRRRVAAPLVRRPVRLGACALRSLVAARRA
jgi:carbon storage regulator